MTDKPTPANETESLKTTDLFVKKTPSPFRTDPYNTRNNKNKTGNKFEKKSGMLKSANLNTSKRKGGSGGDR